MEFWYIYTYLPRILRDEQQDPKLALVWCAHPLFLFCSPLRGRTEMTGRTISRGRTLCRRYASVMTRSCDIIHHSPTVDEFEERFFSSSTPVLLKGYIKDWPAVSTWTLDRFRELGGELLVPVEVGPHYMHPDFMRNEVPLALFLDYLEAAGEKDAPDHNVYLAQHDLLTHGTMQTLRADIQDLPFSQLGRGDRYSQMVWMGPAGTVTPCHIDPYHNLLAQIQGSKRVLLFPPDATPCLYPSTDPLQPNTSQVDVESPDLAQFPAFGDVAPVEALVGEGDVLFIPRKWWHHVRSLTRSTSLSFWWL